MTLLNELNQIREQKEDPEFANLRKKIASGQKKARGDFKKAEKEFVAAAATLVVAEIGWDSGLEEIIEIFQLSLEKDVAAETKKAFKNFNRNANESALGLFQEDDDVVRMVLGTKQEFAIAKAIRKVKL